MFNMLMYVETLLGLFNIAKTGMNYYYFSTEFFVISMKGNIIKIYSPKKPPHIKHNYIIYKEFQEQIYKTVTRLSKHIFLIQILVKNINNVPE